MLRASKYPSLGAACAVVAIVLLGCSGGAATAVPTVAPTAAVTAEPSAASAQPSTAAPTVAPSPVALEVARLGDGRNIIGLTNFVLEHKPEFLAAEGVELSFVSVDSATSVSLVEADQIPMVFGASFSQVTLLHETGATNTVAVGVAMQNNPFDMLAGTDVASFEDLRGKAIAVTSLTAASSDTARLMMQSAGMEADTDYTLVAVGSNTYNGLETLRAGHLDAVMAQPPVTYAGLLDGTLHVLGRGSEYVDGYFGGPVVASQKWLAANGDVMVRIFKAGVRVGQWIGAPENKEEMIALLTDEFGAPPEYAEQFYDEAITGGLVALDWFAPKEAAELQLQILVDTGRLPADRVPPLSDLVDWSYLSQAHEELGVPMRGPLY